MSDALTPERLAEMREDASNILYSGDSAIEERARRILDLIDALEKARAEAGFWRDAADARMTERDQRLAELIEVEARRAEARAEGYSKGYADRGAEKDYDPGSVS